MLYIKILSIYIAFGLLSFIIPKFRKDAFDILSAPFDPFFDEEDPMIYKILFFFTIQLLLFFLVLCLFLLGYPLVLWKLSKEKEFIYGDEKDEHFKYYREGTIFNPGYFKLFLFLTNTHKESEDKQLNGLINEFSKYDSIMFPIVFNKEQGKDIGDDLSFYCEKYGIALFNFTIGKYGLRHPTNENYQHVYSTFDNTNYSFPIEDFEIASAGLSEIFKLPNDGINKIIYVKKDNLNEVFYCGLNEFINITTISTDIDKVEFIQIRHNQSSYDLILKFLSLFWRNSSLPIFSHYKSIASNIEKGLFSNFEHREEVINIFKLVASRTPKVEYQTLIKKGHSEIKDKIMYCEIEDLKKAYPSFSDEELTGIKVGRVNKLLRDLQSDNNIDFDLRIYMKCSDKILELIHMQDLQAKIKGETRNIARERLDYSPSVIGYTKFFEKIINISIVQLIRKEVGIKMPTYFLQYCHLKGEYVVKISNDFIVDFNMKDKKSGKYLPPGMGQSRLSFQSMPNHVKETINEYKIFLNRWACMAEIRNKISHTAIINQNQVQEVKEIIAYMYIDGSVVNLINIKNELRN